MNKFQVGVSALALMAAVTVQGVWAQTEVVPASERMHSAHAPLGIRAGSFLIVPKVDLQGTYNDNIYATNTNEEGDFITTVRPEVTAQSNWNRHALNALARAEFNRYSDNERENYNNYFTAVDGRLDVMRETSLGGGLAFAREHEDRGDPNSNASSVEPTQFDTRTARVGAYRGLGKANARFDSEIKELDYKNGYTAAGAVVDNGLRDRMEYAQDLRLGYKFNSRVEGFVRGVWDTRAYANKGGAIANRSNHGQTYVAGAAFDITGKTRGEVYGGTTTRNYVDASRPDIEEATWGGKATWNVNDLSTVIASVDRTIEETTIGASSGFVATTYDLKGEHALTRDILLTANGGFANNEYQGGAGLQRDDDVMTAGVGADYYFGRNFKGGVSYGFENRESNIAGGDYDTNLLMVRLTASY